MLFWPLSSKSDKKFMTGYTVPDIISVESSSLFNKSPIEFLAFRNMKPHTNTMPGTVNKLISPDKVPTKYNIVAKLFKISVETPNINLITAIISSKNPYTNRKFISIKVCTHLKIRIISKRNICILFCFNLN